MTGASGDSNRVRDDPERRVLVCTVFPRDAALTAECLRAAGMSPLSCPTDDALFSALDEGAGAILLAEERLGPQLVGRLRSCLDGQPPWSDLPIIVFVSADPAFERSLEALEPLGNVTTIERPTRCRAVVSVVRSALRARERQYETRALLDRLSEADRRKDAFIAMLGHELRNPLAAIQGASVLLERMPKKGDRLRRISDVLVRQVKNLQRLVDDSLDLARVTAGKVVLKKERIDLRTAAREISATLEDLAREHGHRLLVDVPADEVPVDADPVRIEQMLGNLLHNAIKYTPDGGTIRLLVETHGGDAVVRVIDNGRGLHPDSLEHIFEPFTQVESTIDRSAGGLGLGLPLVRRLAALHGGSVVAHSEGPGKGVEIVLTLPLVGAFPPRTETHVPIAAPGRGLRILLVDDFVDTLDLLRLGLQERGCTVTTATDGRMALEKAKGGRHDIAFVDIGLPELDGLEVARALRRDRSTAGLPLIAMSGYGRDEDKRRSVSAGFDAHLVKPVDAEQLVQVARDVLERRLPGAKAESAPELSAPVRPE
jgi:signal transduction histidine kinase/ActR/RegA family two-component response regulator